MDDKLRRHISSLPTGQLFLVRGGKSDEYAVDVVMTVLAGESLGKKCLRGKFKTKAEVIAEAVNQRKIGIGRAGYTARAINPEIDLINH